MHIRDPSMSFQNDVHFTATVSCDCASMDAAQIPIPLIDLDPLFTSNSTPSILLFSQLGLRLQSPEGLELACPVWGFQHSTARHALRCTFAPAATVTVRFQPTTPGVLSGGMRQIPTERSGFGFSFSLAGPVTTLRPFNVSDSRTRRAVPCRRKFRSRWDSSRPRRSSVRSVRQVQFGERRKGKEVPSSATLSVDQSGTVCQEGAFCMTFRSSSPSYPLKRTWISVYRSGDFLQNVVLRRRLLVARRHPRREYRAFFARVFCVYVA